MTWLDHLPDGWRAIEPRRHFRERREPSRRGDIHLTPSQHHGVLPQDEYMARTGSKVVLNLAGVDNMKHVEPGDVIAHLRSFQGGLETSWLSGKVSTAYTVIEPLSDVDSRFFRWVFKSSPYIEELAANSQQLRDGQSVKFDDFASSRLPKPPLDVQRRIANFLDERVFRIDNIIAARRQSLGLVDEAAASQRRISVIGSEEVPTDLPWAPLIGADRRVRRLSQLARLGTGHTPSRNNADYWVDCKIPWLTTADVHKFRHDQISVLRETEFQISELGLANSAAVLHPAGTVALSRTASAGFPILMGRAMATSQDFATWTCGSDLRPAFLLGTLRVMRDYLLRYLSMGSTHKTIYFPDLVAIRVLLPDLESQDAAIAEMDAIDEHRASARSALERSIDLLTEYKQSLITAAVTGELDVTTASRQVPA